MMINSFDINPLAHEMHLKELDRTSARNINRDDRVPTLETVPQMTVFSKLVRLVLVLTDAVLNLSRRLKRPHGRPHSAGSPSQRAPECDPSIT